MSHVRQQIREAAATAVTGLTTTGTRVYQNRQHALAESKLPCLLVNTDGEEIEGLLSNAPDTLDRNLELKIRAVAKVSANLDDALDTMAAEVETALGNTTLGNLLKKPLLLQGIEIEMEQGDKPVGIATLKFNANYMTVANAPGTAI